MKFKVGDRVHSTSNSRLGVMTVVEVWIDNDGLEIFKDKDDDLGQTWGWIAEYFRPATPLEEALC